MSLLEHKTASREVAKSRSREAQGKSRGVMVIYSVVDYAHRYFDLTGVSICLELKIFTYLGGY